MSYRDLDVIDISDTDSHSEPLLHQAKLITHRPRASRLLTLNSSTSAVKTSKLRKTILKLPYLPVALCQSQLSGSGARPTACDQSSSFGSSRYSLTDGSPSKWSRSRSFPLWAYSTENFSASGGSGDGSEVTPLSQEAGPSKPKQRGRVSDDEKARRAREKAEEKQRKPYEKEQAQESLAGSGCDWLTKEGPKKQLVSFLFARLEADLYYHGLRGNRKRGPKLIYRTSKDIFSSPSGPSQDLRTMQLLTVHEHAKLGQDNLWPKIRDETVGLLDDERIQHTSVDLVRFRWEEQIEGGRGKTITSPVTIWIGVRPDSTNGDAAFNSAKNIIKLLKQHGIDDIDIAYRESEARPLAGPILYAPVENVHPLKAVIDWVTTPLSLPIAGLETLHMQGTLGFYFKIGEDLYGVTARHVLFPDTEGNKAYRYATSAPKKTVILMGKTGFEDLLESIRILVGRLKNTVIVLEKNVRTHTASAQPGNEQAATDLRKYQQELDNTRATIVALEDFLPTLERDWSDVNNRVIGHVVWSPPITGLTASDSTTPHGYTRDVCVIKLDKEKFLPNFRGNAIDLGTEIDGGKFMSLLYPRYDVPSEFDYPEDRIYQLKVILAASKIGEPNSQDINGEATRFVFKRGLGTLTTVGRLNGFESRTRYYGLLGNYDSVEAAVYPYNNDSGPFSRGGDSGAAIVGANNDFVAQLTGGAGPTDSPDITYGTPMEWLWNDVIKVEFPDAVLFFHVPNN
ncbi:hypothetical protein PQX77_012802 [Marasmius sp. AFHP31]|nr:hypothetical protein PQX77_012802 [Marasmius sp. AFHP31]